MTQSHAPFRVGVVLFPDFELLDVFGPLEMFGALGPWVEISMLAAVRGEVRGSHGPRVMADLALEQASAFDLLLVPGGQGTRSLVNDEAFLAELKRLSGLAERVAAVCTGAALLARTGLLDGRTATTNKLAFDWVAAQRKEVRWVRRARWVEDGCFFTSSGVSAGIDMTLALIEQIFGPESAARVARFAEYLPNTDSTQDPFATEGQDRP